MGSISLLILAAVAGFLFYQLRSVLGQTPYDKDKKPQEVKKTNTLHDRFKTSKPSKDVIVDMSTLSEDYQHPFIKTTSDSHRDDIIQTLNKIKARYDAFDLHKFIDGAKGAYDMILESFNKNLPEDIKNYVSEDIYNNYRRLLDDYALKNYQFQTVVTRIGNVLITAAHTNEVSAKITVEINAYNISCLKDENDKIIQGDPDNVSPVVDIWVFERLYSATTPAWSVISVA
jgi:predicted lipid-binding transport protein (Tim44 family)